MVRCPTMKKRMQGLLIIAAASWLMPVAAFAVAGPPVPDVPLFSWLAVPVAAVAGRKLLNKKGSGRS